ncbi:ribosome assembly factor SBDS [Candidatus Micrarchaeota archaeon]|nr:ribosome assembly factor SBDS [Candidatus Micrarchaeota archaeon]MBU1930684.1 ribosome assembly factor SBDS [Candidatus Micrarchaeota archaeon]
MVKVEDAVIARFEHSGHKFEVLVDPDLAVELRKGKIVSFNDLVALDSVFKDAKKGETQSETMIQKVFGTTEFEKVVKHIILKGQVQLTTDQRRRMLEEKRKELASFIAQNAINPQTKTPHPLTRIEIALEEAKFNVDVFKSIEEQVPLALNVIKPLLPISLEKLKIAVKVPASFSGKANVILHKFGIKKEEWQKDGSLVAVLELPSGLKQELFEELNKMAHGQIETKILE